MEKIKKQMDAKLKFYKNEVYSSYNPTQTRLVKIGGRKNVDNLLMFLLCVN